MHPHFLLGQHFRGYMLLSAYGSFGDFGKGDDQEMKKDLQLGFWAALVTIAPGVILALAGAPSTISVIVTIACSAGGIVAIGRRWYRQIVARTDEQTAHLRSAIGIAATAGGIPTYWTEHSITPETLTQIQQLIAAVGVRQVLELGSGLSTLLIAHSFRRDGGGKVLSLDDDARWAAQTSATLKRENLDGFAEVRVAPLKDVSAGGRTAPWYDLSSLDEQACFDLVIVDGPPAWKGDGMARLPALYELRRRLSNNGVLVLDDASRGGETAIAEQWRRDFPELHFKMIGVGRGLFVACMQKSTLDLLPA
jgi:predicted O-methyltransferase YrrM